MLWKWVSRHRLFNLGTSTCLGLNTSDATQPLGTFECDVSAPMLWWRCSGSVLYGASQWRVAVAGRALVVKKNSHHEWKKYNTPRERPCSHPYEGTLIIRRLSHSRFVCFFFYINMWCVFTCRCPPAAGECTRHALRLSLQIQQQVVL